MLRSSIQKSLQSAQLTGSLRFGRMASVCRSYATQGGAHGHDHHHHHEQPHVELADVLVQRYQGTADQNTVLQRFEQLKRNHMQFLSLDINWNFYKPEQQTEFLRQLDTLIKDGYSSWSQDKKKSFNLANVEQYFDKDLKTWDAVLTKNEELQRGDWKLMSPEEKKAAMYLAFGPVNVTDDSTTKVVGISIAFMVATGIFYYALVKYFRSKKNMPNLTPEWQEAEKERFIKERRNPYTGESAHLFTKDGIKEVE
ncbi:hypothetical protein MP228_001415 [Amoeboaphelidium protococcarum]|nr:hypothetical protein MP228_001415 [Amoeboaphelidium protococcarum]